MSENYGYGIDVVKQLESILANELSKSIDAQIFKKIRGKSLTRKEKIKNIFK